MAKVARHDLVKVSLKHVIGSIMFPSGAQCVSSLFFVCVHNAKYKRGGDLFCLHWGDGGAVGNHTHIPSLCGLPLSGLPSKLSESKWKCKKGVSAFDGLFLPCTTPLTYQAFPWPQLTLFRPPPDHTKRASPDMPFPSLLFLGSKGQVVIGNVKRGVELFPRPWNCSNYTFKREFLSWVYF